VDVLLAGVGQRGLRADGAVVALALDDGRVCWRTPLGGQVRGVPVVDEARVYATACDGRLTCLDLRDGGDVWSRPVVEHAVTIAASPVLVAEHGRTRAIVVATYGRRRDRQGGRVVAFNPRGQHVWAPVEVDGNVASTPVVDGQTLYLTTYAQHPSRGALVALDVRTGKRRWTFARRRAPGERGTCGLRAAPCVHRGTVYVASLDHHLYALDAKTGEVRWQHDLGKGSACRPIWLRGLILVGTNDGNVHAVDAETGARAWAYPLGGRIFTTPRPFAGGALVASQRGELAALPWHLGRYAWAADRLARAGRFSEAGDCRAMAAYHAPDLDARVAAYNQAEADWGRAGEMEKAGRVWLSLDRREEAAEAFRQAGEHWRPRDQRRAARYFKQAADLFFALRRDELLATSTRALSVCAQLPHLHIEPASTGFVRWEPSTFALRLTNDGRTPAHNVKLCLLGGALEEPLAATIVEPLDPGQSWNVPLTVTPTRAESPLVIELVYASGGGAYDPLYSRLAYTIRAPERPQAPVQVGDVGVFKMEIGGMTEEGVVIQTQDVGLIRDGLRRR
jgi:outer membrane protein assembly factor BamB